MTGNLFAFHLKSPRTPLVVRVPQFENHWSWGSINSFPDACDCACDNDEFKCLQWSGNSCVCQWQSKESAYVLHKLL